MSHERLLIALLVVVGSATVGLGGQAPHIMKQWSVNDGRVVWVDVSIGADTVFFLSEAKSGDTQVLHWAKAPNYGETHSCTVETAAIDHAVSSDGRFIALVLAGGVLRIIDTDEASCRTVRDVALASVARKDLVDNTAPRDIRVRFIDEDRLIVLFQGIIRRGAVSIVSAERPGEILEQRALEGLALQIGGTRERLLIAGSQSIYAEDWSGRVMYGFRAFWPIFFGSTRTHGWFCSMVPQLGSERAWFVGVWELETGKVLGRLSLDGQSIAALPVFGDHGNCLYVLRGDGVMIRWDYVADTRIDRRLFPAEMPGFVNERTAIAARDQGLVVVTSSMDTVSLYSFSFGVNSGIRDASGHPREEARRSSMRNSRRRATGRRRRR